MKDTRRGEGGAADRGADTHIASNNLGGIRDYDPDHTNICRCGEDPKFEWVQPRGMRGKGRIVCACGRASSWCATKVAATLAWNDLGSEPICSEPVRRKL